MKNLLTQFWNNEDGVTAIEYALIGVAMAVVVGTAFGSSTSGIRKELTAAFKTIQDKIASGAK
ncbi:Flp family type IVb pilin [Photobacterium swingsii]|uniref:Flp family type IVb pilin n=1 Tax=Photobacterium swingsii TaxID=680026 RepID=UPI004067F017